jgi:helicase
MLPTYIQYGVKTPEAAVVSLLGVPRPCAEAFGMEYREHHGTLEPSEVGRLKSFVYDATEDTWERVVSRARVKITVDPVDLRAVWRQMHGLV